jgi:hypothetical protein
MQVARRSLLPDLALVDCGMPTFDVVTRRDLVVLDGVDVNGHVLVSPEGIATASLTRRWPGWGTPQPGTDTSADVRRTRSGGPDRHDGYGDEACGLQFPGSVQTGLIPPPVALPEVVFDLIWHRRNDAHQAQQWLRELIALLAVDA